MPDGRNGGDSSQSASRRPSVPCRPPFFKAPRGDQRQDVRIGQRRRRPEEIAEERHELRIELCPGVPPQLGDRDVVRDGALVRAVVDHRGIGIGNRDDPGTERDLRRPQAERIPASRVALVVVEDDRSGVLEGRRQLQDDLADPGMLDHAPPLGAGQLAGLVEDLGRNGDLAHVVEQRGHADSIDLPLGKLERSRHRHDDRRDQRRLALVVVERRDDRREVVGGGFASLATDLDGACPSCSGDRGARDPRVLVGLGEDVGLVSAERLRRVHGGVGVAHERLHAKLLADPADDPDRDRHRQPGVGLDREMCAFDERPQLLGQGSPFLDAGLGQDQHEFLAAVAADQVAGPQVARDDLGHPAQHDVATLVPVAVVDHLEMVDVDEGDAQRPFVAGGSLDLGEQLRQERLPVVDAGQAVDRRPVVRVGHGSAIWWIRFGRAAI